MGVDGIAMGGMAAASRGWGSRAWIVRNARWMGPTMLDDPPSSKLDHLPRLAASPSSAETVMRNSKNTDIRQVLPWSRRRPSCCIAKATR